MRSMASVALLITAPPSVAVWLTACAISLAGLRHGLALSTTVGRAVSMVAEVSSIVAACLVVRSLRSLAPERISRVAVRSELRRALEAADEMVERVDDRVDVVLEAREGAAMLARHADREVLLGEGGQHVARFLEAVLDGIDQIVDARGELVDLGIGEIRRDASTNIHPARANI